MLQLVGSERARPVGLHPGEHPQVRPPIPTRRVRPTAFTQVKVRGMDPARADITRMPPLHCGDKQPRETLHRDSTESLVNRLVPEAPTPR